MTSMSIWRSIRSSGCSVPRDPPGFYPFTGLCRYARHNCRLPPPEHGRHEQWPVFHAVHSRSHSVAEGQRAVCPARPTAGGLRSRYRRTPALEDNPFQPGEPVQAVAAFMAPAHTSIFTSAYQARTNAPVLPLFAYTAVGWSRDRFWVAAFRSDPDKTTGQRSVQPVNRRNGKRDVNCRKHPRQQTHPASRQMLPGLWLPGRPQLFPRALGGPAPHLAILQRPLRRLHLTAAIRLLSLDPGTDLLCAKPERDQPDGD